MNQKETVSGLIAQLNGDNIVGKLTTFSEFHNRYYKSASGQEASEWLLSEVTSVVEASGVAGASVKAFDHSWVQKSIIATIPGKSTDKIVIGAHLDSVNGGAPQEGRSPGAGAWLFLRVSLSCAIIDPRFLFY